jgi:hypothetical protein
MQVTVGLGSSRNQHHVHPHQSPVFTASNTSRGQDYITKLAK